MSHQPTIDANELRPWLTEVSSPETIRRLMIAIAHAEGVDVDMLADWFDLDAPEIEDWLESIAGRPLTVVIAAEEGVDFDAIAERSGLGRPTVIEWFEALDNRPIEESADIIRRYSQRRSGPLLKGTKSRVHYLDYEAVQEQGWSLDDDDLFEKASSAGLEPAQYGRFLVEAGETILEGAEHRGIDWPYACRAGACANCAVIVKEGDVAMPGQTILSANQVQRMNARLTCVGVPVSEELKLVMNVQQLEGLDELRLPSPMQGSTPAL